MNSLETLVYYYSYFCHTCCNKNNKNKWFWCTDDTPSENVYDPVQLCPETFVVTTGLHAFTIVDSLWWEALLQCLKYIYQGLLFETGFTSITMNYVMWHCTEDTSSELNCNIVQMILETVLVTTIWQISCKFWRSVMRNCALRHDN